MNDHGLQDHGTQRLTARARLLALIPAFDSEGERWWQQYGALLLGDEAGSAVVWTQYHPLTFRLPGGSYTPDFLHILADGRIVLVEVKGSKQQKGYRDARSKLRAAAEVYGWLVWYEAIIGRNGCEVLELIE